MYKENKLLNLELKNMYVLQEENKDLREDLKLLKAITHDEKVKQMNDENQTLRKRNGKLLFENEELSRQVEELKRQLKDAQT